MAEEAPQAVVIWFRNEEKARGIEGELGTDFGLEKKHDSEMKNGLEVLMVWDLSSLGCNYESQIKTRFCKMLNTNFPPNPEPL